MRIHEVLEACVEYVAYEGFLGSDVLSLQQHLAKRDASLDATSFAYLYTLLCQHPSILISISTYPLPSADRTIQLGTAPLPADYAPPDEAREVDFDRLYREGKRGRELAFHLAGEEHLTSRQAVEAKRQEQERIRLEKLTGRFYEVEQAASKGKKKGKKDLEQVVGEDGTILFTVLDEDDAELGGEAVEKTDLAGLAEKWGSRLRIRCTDDEIYFRLTGSHQKLPKLSAVVLHTLALAARARERGITAIELGPMVHASQGSMHYYMKVLVEMGLCAKVPAVLHGSITNLLLFHPFLELNENYRAIKKLGPLPTAPAAPIPEPDQADPSGTTTLAGVEEEDDHDSTIDDDGGSGATGYDFGPMTEQELMTGHVVKERLIQLLEHPALQNHLLKSKNLLAILGWKTVSAMRHRRAIPRHIAALVMDGVIERLEVGPKRIDCLRLTKYNPKYAGPPKPAVEMRLAEEDVEQVILYQPQDFSERYNQLGGIALNLSFERQINDVVMASGQTGALYSDIRASMAQAYKRSIEFHLVRAEEMRVPPQLRESAISSLMENYRRERRLRVFTIEAYRAFLLSQGQTPDDKQFPPLTAEAGRWCDIDYRSFATDVQTFWKRAERVFDLKEAQTSVIPPPKKVQRIRDADELKNRKKRADSGKRKPRDEAGKVIPPKQTRKRANSPASDEDTSAFRSKPKYYDNEVQQRGRPRKYIQVVNEDGKVNRLIVGQIIPNPKLPLVLIYVTDAGKLVPAPEGYSGVGKPPPVTAEQLKKGHPPEWFKSFPKGKKYPGKEKKKAEAKKSAKGKGKNTGDAAEVEVQEDEEAEQVLVEEEGLVGGKEDEIVNAEEDQLADEKEDDPIPIDEAEPTTALQEPTATEAQEEVAPLPQPVAGPSVLPKKRARQSKATSVIVEEEQPAKKRKSSRQAKGRKASVEPSERGKSASKTPRSPTLPIVPLPTGDFDDPAMTSTAQATPARAVTPLVPIMNKDNAMNGGDPTQKVTSTAEKEGKGKQSAKAKTDDRETNARKTNAARSTMTPTTDARRGSKEPSKQRTLASPVASSTGRPQTITETFTVDASRTNAKSANPPSSPETSRRQRPTETGRERVDLALVRRNNELCEALKEYGGVLSDTRFLSAHREWVAKVAGTDAPAAPAAAYNMDRRIFKLSLPVLEREGRIKMTTCAVPTTTGRWIQQIVIWLADTPKADVDTYISNLTQMTLSALTLPVKKGRVQIEDQAFSEARPMGGPGTSAKATVIKPSMRQDTPSTLRRNALIRQPGVGATLLGYISGRWVRVQRFLEALFGAMEDEAGSTSRVSKSPKVFTLPLIFEDIPVGTFYQCIFSTAYDEELDEWLQDPENQRIRLKDVPEKFRPERGGFAGGKAKTKYRTILTTLWQLGIISPLIPCPMADADLSIPGPDGGKSFKVTATVTSATHFIIHDFAPVYHLAVDTAGLLGVLPIMQKHERAMFWSITRDACVKENINDLRPIECHTAIGLPQTARITDKLELDLDLMKLMRSPVRWKDEVRILPEQRQAIDQQVDWRQGIPKISSEEEIERFAYENALTVPYVRTELARRAQQARDRATAIALREAIAAKDLAERREKNQRSLRQKLAEMRQESKKAWEERIMKAAEVAGVPYTQDIVNFVTHHTLSVPNRAKLGDKAIEDAVKLSLKVNQTRSVALGKQIVKPAEKPKLQYTLPPAKTTFHRGQRRRHHWTPEDDDLLLDAEAILRARARGKQRGRHAMSQVFPDIAHQSILNRFKKVVAENGKQAYYDRLEQTWYDLWMYHRGSAELRDEDPDSTSNFDLRHHIEFLRTHIRKSDLRLGITTTTEIIHAKVPDLPADHDVLLQTQQWRYNKTEQTTMQQVTENVIGEEAKEKAYAAVAYRDEGNDAQNGFSRERGILRAGLKMITATPVETYHPAAAKLFIDHFNTYDLTPEITSLVDEKILIKQHNAAHTSRAHGFTALWSSASEGLFPAEMNKEATAIKDGLRANKEGGIEWSAVCAGGDIAALLEMASDGIVDIDFDAESIPVRALKNTYNTRVLDDDAFEFKFKVIPCADIPASSESVILRPEAGPSNTPWTDVDVDDEETHLAVNNVLDLVHAAGPDGISKAEIQEKANLDIPLLSAVFASLASDTPPETFWAGYDTSRLISAEHWKAWTHVAERRVDEKGKPIGQPSVGRVRPGRWVDIYGGLIQDDWDRCLRNVAGQVASRPGILEVNLRAKVGMLLDRMETNEVIQCLVDKGTLKRAWVSDDRRDALPPVEAMGLEDEGQVAYWSDQAFSI